MSELQREPIRDLGGKLLQVSWGQNYRVFLFHFASEWFWNGTNKCWFNQDVKKQLFPRSTGRTRGSNEIWEVWNISPCLYLCSYIVTMPFTTKTHTHAQTQTHPSRLQQTLSEYISPHVDNVTFPVFHYLVLTVSEHLTRFPPSLCIYFGISGMFWEQLRLCAIAAAAPQGLPPHLEAKDR